MAEYTKEHRNFAQMGKYIVTAEQDGRVTLNALVVAELVEPTNNVRDDLRLVMLAQANAYPRLVEALRDISSGLSYSHGPYLADFEKARALLAELGE